MKDSPELRAAIRATRAFRDLSDDNLALLIEAAELQTFDPDAALMVQGEISDSTAESGCVFRARCWLYRRMDRPDACEQAQPSLRQLGGGEAAACHFVEAVRSQGAVTMGSDWSMETRRGEVSAGAASSVLTARP